MKVFGATFFQKGSEKSQQVLTKNLRGLGRSPIKQRSNALFYVKSPSNVLCKSIKAFAVKVFSQVFFKKLAGFGAEPHKNLKVKVFGVKEVAKNPNNFLQ